MFDCSGSSDWVGSCVSLEVGTVVTLSSCFCEIWPQMMPPLEDGRIQIPEISLDVCTVRIVHLHIQLMAVYKRTNMLLVSVVSCLIFACIK